MELQAVKALKDFDFLSETCCLLVWHSASLCSFRQSEMAVGSFFWHAADFGKSVYFPRVYWSTAVHIHARFGVWYYRQNLLSLLMKARWQYLIWPQCPVKMFFLPIASLGYRRSGLHKKESNSNFLKRRVVASSADRNQHFYVTWRYMGLCLEGSSTDVSIRLFQVRNYLVVFPCCFWLFSPGGIWICQKRARAYCVWTRFHMDKQM